MKARMGMTCLTLAAGVLIGAVASHVVSAQGAEDRTVLLTSDLAGIDGYEIRMWRTKLGPGVIGAKHYHPGTECIYVIDGALDLDEAGKTEHLTAGSAHCVAPRTVLLPRNASSSQPYSSLVVMIAPKGQPIAVPVQ